MKTERYEVVNLIAETEDEMITVIKGDDCYRVTHVMGIELSIPYLIEDLPTPKEGSTGYYRYKAVQVTDYAFNRHIKAMVHVASCYCRWKWTDRPKNECYNELLEDMRPDGYYFTVYDNNDIEIKYKYLGKNGKLIKDDDYIKSR